MAYARTFMLREHKEAHRKNPGNVSRDCKQTQEFFANRKSKLREGIINIDSTYEQKVKQLQASFDAISNSDLVTADQVNSLFGRKSDEQLTQIEKQVRQLIEK